jgi:hypothetical protein
VIFFVCRIDGTQIGEFEEAEFRDKVLARQITAQDYYWHEGMTDWRPVSEYRAIAKTQRISFAPPPRPTVKIDMTSTASLPREPAKKSDPISRLLDRIRRKK